MYEAFALVSLLLGGLLVPFFVPIRLENPILRRIRLVISLSLAVCLLIALTPSEAVKGAPFNKFGLGKIAFSGCSHQVLKLARFCDTGLDDHCFCADPNAMATISQCYLVAHTNEVDSFLSMCKLDYDITVTREQFNEAHVYYTKHSQTINQSEQGPATLVKFPVRLEEAAITLYKNSYDQFLGNYDRSVDYGFYLVCYWTGVFMVAAIGNWSKVILPGLHSQLTDPLTNWFRRTVSLPATLGRRKTHEQPFFRVFNFLAPTRAETLMLGAFCLLTAFFLQHNIHFYAGDPLFVTKEVGLYRYYAVRSGILASLLCPLLILFGGRNNFLQWFCRWDYSTFIMFHRWVSRVIVLLVMIHSFFYKSYLEGFGMSEELNATYVTWGRYSASAGFFILVQGLLVLRRKWYEAFLLIHIGLALVFIAGAWYHTKDKYCGWFYYYSLAIWIFDRAVRIGRLWSFGFPKASVLLLADETLKIIVPKPEHWEAVPGGHAFIHFLRPSCFWQSHPFTYTVSVNAEETNIILYIKVKKGITRQLFNFLVTHPGRSVEIRVAIEGSYGEKTPASGYNNAVFVAGGNGIPGIYAEVYDLERKTAEYSQRTFQLVWVVSEYASLFWFYEELLSLLETRIQTTVYVTRPGASSCVAEFERRFPMVAESSAASLTSQKEDDGYSESRKQRLLLTITSSYNSIPMTSGLRSSKEQVQKVIRTIKTELPHITFKEGRPSIAELTAASIKNSLGSTCFVTCGHPAMVDDVRHCVVENISNEENKRVDYFEQLQVWA